MKKKNNAISVIFFLIGLTVFAYTGYLVAGAWYEGIEFTEFMASLQKVFGNPLRDYRNENTLKGVAFASMAFGLVFLLYITSRKNLMIGKEFGTARWEAPDKVTKRFREKKDEFADRLISRNIRLSINDRKTRLNNNELVVGGAGSGKSFYYAKPNLMQLYGSYVITDSKGEMYRALAPMFKKNGYRVICLNLIEPERSDCYNPFAYLRKETDIIRLITNLISNTTPKNSMQQDPFWEKAESLLLQALFFYVWIELPPARRNFESVLRLLKEAEVTDGKRQSELDRRFARLEKKSPLGGSHPALIKYREAFSGAGDTVRSILISAHARLALLENKEILRVLSDDDMRIADIGTGANRDGRTKTALFCVIPDNDKSYNFLVGMLYTQCFQELYYQADFMYRNGRLPIHVKFMLDEFANVALPDDFCSLLSTMRGRNISSTIIIQNMAQIKALFDKTWETIPGNCDIFVYLGGNEQSTFEYINKLLDKATIDKRSHGQTLGRYGNASKNYDVLGRELMTIGEVRKLPNDECIVFIRGVDPVRDGKYIPFGHPRFSQSGDADEKLQADMEGRSVSLKPTDPEVMLLTPEAAAYYERLKKRGADIRIDEIDARELLMLSEEDFLSGQRKRRFTLEEESGAEISGSVAESAGNARSIGVPDDSEDADGVGNAKSIVRIPGAVHGPIDGAGDYEGFVSGEDLGGTITERMLLYDFCEEQFEEAKLALKSGITEKELLSYFYPDKTAEEMRQNRERLLKKI